MPKQYDNQPDLKRLLRMKDRIAACKKELESQRVNFEEQEDALCNQLQALELTIRAFKGEKLIQRSTASQALPSPKPIPQLPPARVETKPKEPVQLVRGELTVTSLGAAQSFISGSAAFALYQDVRKVLEIERGKWITLDGIITLLVKHKVRPTANHGTTKQQLSTVLKVARESGVAWLEHARDGQRLQYRVKPKDKE